MTRHVTLKSAMKAESIGQFSVRVKNGGGRKPLRSFKEFCVEFCISEKVLKGMLNTTNAPKAKFSTGGGGSSSKRNTWYDSAVMRKWWNVKKLLKPLDKGEQV